MRALTILKIAQGFSMIEALVALLITAVGILGTVSLQGVVLGNTKTSNDHSIASLQVGNLISRSTQVG
jgi:Tfp pilus assembly protein PilV